MWLGIGSLSVRVKCQSCSFVPVPEPDGGPDTRGRTKHYGPRPKDYPSLTAC